MELPIDFTADSVRDEKVKVIRAIPRIHRDNVSFGQYQAGMIDGEAVPGYREEEGVEPESNTPTYVGIKLFIDTLRWAGVPFFLRTGKRLPKRLTQIAVTFRPTPLCLFHGRHDSCQVDPNVLLITLQPDEGFSLLFDIKAPGEPLRLEPQALDFRYENAFGPLPTAYQTLLLDVMEGDQTLFVRADEVEESWKVYSPLVDDDSVPHRYDAGTWGPAAMDQGVALGGAEWMGR
ncbi:MAG: glucose-6-phosphate dehydrogenase, partial [Actinobacteria bacterium]|nr:glucose-6-phosphate dehydrogenase [Actinomycetota bacterium]